MQYAWLWLCPLNVTQMISKAWAQMSLYCKEIDKRLQDGEIQNIDLDKDNSVESEESDCSENPKE